MARSFVPRATARLSEQSDRLDRQRQSPGEHPRWMWSQYPIWGADVEVNLCYVPATSGQVGTVN